MKVVELDIAGGDVEPEPAIKQIELCADLKIIRDLRIEPNGFVGSRCLAIEAAAFEAARVAGIGKQVRAWLVLPVAFGCKPTPRPLMPNLEIFMDEYRKDGDSLIMGQDACVEHEHLSFVGVGRA